MSTALAPGINRLSRLNGWPMRSPVNASLCTSRCTAHDSGPMWLAIPSSQRTCTAYSLPVSRRTDISIWLGIRHLNLALTETRSDLASERVVDRLGRIDLLVE